MEKRKKIILNSLPPQINNKKYGELILRIIKYEITHPSSSSSSSGTPGPPPGPIPLKYLITFQWFGQQQNERISIPFSINKMNQIIEYIFPIHVNSFYFQEYLLDMNELYLNIYTTTTSSSSSNLISTSSTTIPSSTLTLYGYCIINMETILNNNLLFRDSINVYKSNTKIILGKLFIEFLCQFNNEFEKDETSPHLSVFQRVEVCFNNHFKQFNNHLDYL